MHEAPTILPNWLAQRAASAPERLALQCEGQEWSFRALDAWATATAQQLAAAGAQPGERMALLLNNRPEYVALIHAAPRLGISFVPLNTRLAAPELAWQLHEFRVEAPDLRRNHCRACHRHACGHGRSAARPNAR